MFVAAASAAPAAAPPGSLEDGGRKVAAEDPGDLGPKRRHAAAEEPVAGLLHGDLHPFAAEPFGQLAKRDRLAVDQHAVAAVGVDAVIIRDALVARRAHGDVANVDALARVRMQRPEGLVDEAHALHADAAREHGLEEPRAAKVEPLRTEA